MRTQEHPASRLFGPAGYEMPRCFCMQHCRRIRCHTLLQIGQRYAWIDLTAGPLTYGPHGRLFQYSLMMCNHDMNLMVLPPASGTGLITDSSLPSLDSFRYSRLFQRAHTQHAFSDQYRCAVLYFLISIQEPSLRAQRKCDWSQFVARS
jgi:hypothetical protein